MPPEKAISLPPPKKALSFLPPEKVFSLLPPEKAISLPPPKEGGSLREYGERLPFPIYKYRRSVPRMQGASSKQK